MNVTKLYGKACYEGETVIMDMEFDKIKTILQHLSSNTTAAQEHVTEVEQNIWVLKERCQGILLTLPFKQIPNILLIQLFQFVIMWLNAFPVKGGISSRLSPTELISRHRLDALKDCQTLFVTYCEVHNEP